MTVEEELTKLGTKIDGYQKQNVARANRDKYSHLGFILWAFALATTSLALEMPNFGNVGMAIVFYLGGAASLFYSSRFRV